MDESSKKSTAWGSGAGLVGALFVGGLTLLILWRSTVLPGNPWGYIGLAMAGFAAVLAMILFILKAVTASRSNS